MWAPEAYKHCWWHFILFTFGYATLATGAPWVFQSKKYLTLQILYTCDIALLIITGSQGCVCIYRLSPIRMPFRCDCSQASKAGYSVSNMLVCHALYLLGSD